MRKFSSVVPSSLLVSKVGNVAQVVLNRPKALNALNTEMCAAMKQQLTEMKQSKEFGALLMKGEGGKAFCAGGDVRTIWDDVDTRGAHIGTGKPGIYSIFQFSISLLLLKYFGKGFPSNDFFREEYEMNYMLGTSLIPQVSIRCIPLSSICDSDFRFLTTF